jgi:hypothetical protein
LAFLVHATAYADHFAAFDFITVHIQADTSGPERTKTSPVISPLEIWRSAYGSKPLKIEDGAAPSLVFPLTA